MNRYFSRLIELLVGGLEHFLLFHILGMSESQLTHIFQRGRAQPPTSLAFWIQKAQVIPDFPDLGIWQAPAKAGDRVAIVSHWVGPFRFGSAVAASWFSDSRCVTRLLESRGIAKEPGRLTRLKSVREIDWMWNRLIKSRNRVMVGRARPFDPSKLVIHIWIGN